MGKIKWSGEASPRTIISKTAGLYSACDGSVPKETVFLQKAQRGEGESLVYGVCIQSSSDVDQGPCHERMLSMHQGKGSLVWTQQWH